jgi:hypothetical protein
MVMRLEHDENSAVLRLTGRDPQRRLVLTPGERAALVKAQEICAKAAELLNEDGNYPAFLDAEARLAEVLA